MTEPEKEKKPESYFARGAGNRNIQLRRNKSNAETFVNFQHSQDIELTDNLHTPDGKAVARPPAIEVEDSFGGRIVNCSTDGGPMVEIRGSTNIQISDCQQGGVRPKSKAPKSKRQIVVPELPWKRDKSAD